MVKSKIDQLLNKEHPNKEDLQFIVDYYSKKPFEELTEHEANYLDIAKNLLEAEKNKEPKEEPIVNKKEKALEIIKSKIVNISFNYGGKLGNIIQLRIGLDTCYLHFDENDKNFDLLKEVLSK